MRERSLAYKYAQAFFNTHPSFQDWQRAHALKKEIEPYTTPLTLIEQMSTPFAVPQLMRVVDALIAQTDRAPFESLMRLLASHKRLSLLGPVLTTLEQLMHHLPAATTASVATAHPLTDEQKRSLEEALKKKFQEVRDVLYTQDARLVAGIQIRIGFLLWDYSLLRRFDQLRAVIAKVCHGY